jgi:NitT/TauT family transport system ATP-binding protein
VTAALPCSPLPNAQLSMPVVTDSFPPPPSAIAPRDDTGFVAVDRVHAVFGSGPDAVVALADVSLHAKRGQFVSIVGPSGCGKSTLLRAISGLLPVQGGTITVNGHAVSGPYLRAGLVFQKAALFDWRTALDNVLLQAEIRGLPPREYRQKAMALLDLVGLRGFEHRYPDELSGGMQQRVAICRALLHDPDLLLMDEPFGALDAITRERMHQELEKTWIAKPKTIVFITHDIEEACFLSERVDVMSPRPGRIVASVPIDFARPRPLSIKSSPQFQQHVARIRDAFDQLGVYRDA